MSAIRLSVPGQPVRLIDLGPAVGRVTFTRYGIKNGSTDGAPVLGMSERDRARAAQREYKARQRNAA